MILVDIDGTVSPTQPTEQMFASWQAAGGYRSEFAGGFTLVIPNYILDFLNSRSDIYMLSTWNDLAATVPEAFGFEAQTLDMTEHTDARGIQGKFEVVKSLGDKPLAWLDDHIKPIHKDYCATIDCIAIKPRKNSCLSVNQIDSLHKSLNLVS